MFHDVLTSLRKKAGVTQDQFARDFNCSRSTVAMWESGQRTPDLETLSKIADYFGVSIDVLAGKEQPKSSSATITDRDLQVALFGGDEEVTDEMWEAVKKFAAFVKSQEEGKK